MKYDNFFNALLYLFLITFFIFSLLGFQSKNNPSSDNSNIKIDTIEQLKKEITNLEINDQLEIA